MKKDINVPTVQVKVLTDEESDEVKKDIFVLTVTTGFKSTDLDRGR
jgi:uncharacterized protein (DUF111 family)